MALTAGEHQAAVRLLGRYQHAPPAGQINWQLVGEIVALYRGRRTVRVRGWHERERQAFADSTRIEINSERDARRTRTWFAQPWEVFISMRLCQLPSPLPPKRPVEHPWMNFPNFYMPQPEHDAADRCVKCRKSHLGQSSIHSAIDIAQCLGQ